MKEKSIKSNGKFILSKEHKISDFYTHFKKAKDDNTLDIMFEGLNKQLSLKDWDSSLKKIMDNNIYIAYGNRQEDFDGVGSDSQNVAAKKVEAIEKTTPNLTPEEKLSAALKGLYQG